MPRIIIFIIFRMIRTEERRTEVQVLLGWTKFQLVFSPTRRVCPKKDHLFLGHRYIHVQAVVIVL